MKILDQVGSLLASLQGNKILQKITKQKDEGFYKNELEFRQALKAGLLDIASIQDQPLFVPTMLSTGLAHSEIFNNNNQEILLDLEVLFEEINYIFSKIKSHEIFFERSVVEAEVLLKKLEQRLESAKIEASADNSFNKVFHNTFIDASNKVDFTNIAAKEFYYDSIIKRRTNLDNLCSIDIKQGKLGLPKISAQRVSIAEAKISTTESTVSDYDVSFPGNNLSNIISSSFIQSWSHTILTKKQLKEPAKLVLIMDLGDLKEFNTITINPNNNEPAYLSEIYTVDALGVKHNFEISPGILSESQTFIFPKTTAKAVYLTLKQDKNKIIPHDPSEPISLAQLQRDPTLPLTINSITGQIQESIKDPNIKNTLGLGRTSLAESQLVYYYSFSINSVQIGNDDYKKKGIYVAKPESFEGLRNLGLYTGHHIPTTSHWETNIEMLSGSIEYNLFKKDYDAVGNLVKSTIVPILPVGTTQVLNERLHFEESTSLQLRFRAHKGNGNASNVEVYRNGELLIRGVDWRFRNRQTINPADPMIVVSEDRTIIELTQTNEQILNGVYWAKYVPRYVSEPESVVVDNGVRFLENCTVVTPNIIYGQEIKKTDVYVQVIIRNHTESSALTPYVDYYRLAGKEE